VSFYNKNTARNSADWSKAGRSIIKGALLHQKKSLGRKFGISLPVE
jgi:hypothetical protein